jgi:hypothetical protein
MPTHIVPANNFNLTDLVSHGQEHLPSLREEEVVTSVNPVLFAQAAENTISQVHTLVL